MTAAGAKAEGFLDGVLVVSIEQAVAAPLTTCRLADAGARVIKVERPGGDFARQYDTAANGESAFFVWLNRGKESLEVDFRQPEGEALLHRIIAKADVLVQNLAPGAAERAGFGAEAMRRRHPRLITCSISGYGEEGPYREMRAYDMLVQAESGLASITGTPEAPGRIGVSACDIGTGLNALSAILQALYARTRTGEGAALSVSMFDSMADWMAVPLLLHDLTGQTMARTGLSHPLIAPYGAFPVAGGGSLLISIQNEREWRRFCEGVLERPGMTGDPRFRSNVERLANREALDAEIGAVFTGLPRSEVEARLRQHRIAFGAINTVAGLSAHPQLRRATVNTPSGEIQLPAPPGRERCRSGFQCVAAPAW
ncbi:MAG: CoA transferase [SAR324 cluster bacterium]|nr:CoA transferase [SAR324 cluster bacterium]